MLLSPRDVDLPGSQTTFSTADDELVTDLFVDHGCDVDGRYRWSIVDGTLSLAPMDDRCEQRRVLLATRAWRLTDPTPASDALQGDWTATFTCEEMVAAVARAPIANDAEGFWLQATADELGSSYPRSRVSRRHRLGRSRSGSRAEGSRPSTGLGWKGSTAATSSTATC